MPRCRLRIYSIMVVNLFLLFCPATTLSIDITIDRTITYQTIEGFGGGFIFGVWPYGRTSKLALYDSIFSEAGCTIVRIGNFYDPEMADTGEVTEIPMMKEVQTLYPQVKVILASWSPPAYLKAEDTVAGILDGKKLSLKKEQGLFVYGKYADYWYKSIDHFQKGGVALGWVSIQNEPDWPAAWDGCYLAPIESEMYASYGKALDSVYTRSKILGVPFIGPDMTGITGNDYSLKEYMDNLNRNHLSAICHHLYNGVDISSMRSVKRLFSVLPRFQTEHLINEGDTVAGKILTWFDHVNRIQNSLLEEDISMYLLFALTYKTASTHCFFSLDSSGDSFTIRPIYYAFKHFSRSIHPGWRRIEAHCDGNLKVSAFSNDQGDSIAIVVINNGESTTMNIQGIASRIENGDVYQTVKGDLSEQLKKYFLCKRFSGNLPQIELDKQSITTVDIRLKKSDAVVPLNKPTSTGNGVKVTIDGNNNILIIMSGLLQPSTVSLVTISGRIVLNSTKKNRQNSPAIHLLNSSRLKGVYVLIIKSAVETMNIPLILP